MQRKVGVGNLGEVVPVLVGSLGSVMDKFVAVDQLAVGSYEVVVVVVDNVESMVGKHVLVVVVDNVELVVGKHVLVVGIHVLVVGKHVLVVVVDATSSLADMVPAVDNMVNKMEELLVADSLADTLGIVNNVVELAKVVVVDNIAMGSLVEVVVDNAERVLVV